MRSPQLILLMSFVNLRDYPRRRHPASRLPALASKAGAAVLVHVAGCEGSREDDLAQRGLATSALLASPSLAAAAARKTFGVVGPGNAVGVVGTGYCRAGHRGWHWCWRCERACGLAAVRSSFVACKSDHSILYSPLP